LPYPVFLISFAILAGFSAALGVWLTNLPEVSRKVVPFSGAVLVLISVLWILPELVHTFGWSLGPAMLLAAFSIIWFIDRYIYAVCPTCAHTHNHDSCSTRLHGFALPLIIASVIHSVFDGWMFAVGQAEAQQALSSGILIHKLPECVAFGVILRAALRSHTQAIFWSFASQAPMLVGAAIEPAAENFLGSLTVGAMLALGGGTFLYLGFHAVHGEWKRRTAARAVRIS
jgi:zinc transporter ZupT